jgi:lysine 2-monooxygenase
MIGTWDPGARLDLAVIGAGAAGTSVARQVAAARPRWSIALFERTDRIGGRLRSRHLEHAAHPIELGGMRYLSSQPLISSVVREFNLATHLFDSSGGPDRTVLRGVVSAGAGDSSAGDGYDLAANERGRSASDLAARAFEALLPDYQAIDHEGYAERRATATYRGRPVTDWSISDVLSSVLSPEGHRFVVDAFGYDSGMRAFNAADLIEFLFSGGDPTEEARSPGDGMDRIPKALASAFEAAGGTVHLRAELESFEPEPDGVALRFATGEVLHAARLVLAVPVPALGLLATTSASLRAEVFSRVIDSVEPFPAMKLYLSYAEPWWRPSVAGLRTVTDLPNRKIFYFDGGAGEGSLLLGMYTDGRDVAHWVQLAGGASDGAPAPTDMLTELARVLRAVHPGVTELPEPLETALMSWGTDPHETGWHFWRSGFVSDEVLRVAPQPDPSLPVYLANEAFSRRQSWAEGALEAADAAVQLIVSQVADSRLTTR